MSIGTSKPSEKLFQNSFNYFQSHDNALSTWKILPWNFSVEMTVCDTNSAFKKSSNTDNFCRFDETGSSANIFSLMSFSGIKFLKWRFGQYAMLDGRFLSNYFPSGILKHLSTISFSDSLDKLNDQLDVKDEDENCNLSLFSRLDLDFFFSFCYSVLLFLSLSALLSISFPFYWIVSFSLLTWGRGLWIFWYPLYWLIIWVISSFIAFYPASSL